MGRGDVVGGAPTVGRPSLASILPSARRLVIIFFFCEALSLIARPGGCNLLIGVALYYALATISHHTTLQLG